MHLNGMFLNRFATPPSPQLTRPGPPEDNAVAERIKLKEFQISELKRLLAESRSATSDLERARLSDAQALSDARRELDDVRIKHGKEAAHHKIEIAEIKKEGDVAREQLLAYERDLRRNEKNLPEYEELVDEMITAVAQDSDRRRSSCSNLTDDDDHETESLCSINTSNKQALIVARLKRQLSRALQKMETLQNQVALVKTSCDTSVKAIKEEASAQLEERCKAEVELLNQLADLGRENKLREESLRDELEAKDKEKAELQERLEFFEGRLRDLESSVVGSGLDFATVQEDAESESFAPSAPSSPPTQKLQDLRKEKDEMEKKYRSELKDRDRMIAFLEEENYMKDRELKKLQMGGSDGGLDADIVGNKFHLSTMTGLNFTKDYGVDDGEAGDNTAKFHESWTPGTMERRGSAEGLLKQQEKLRQAEKLKQITNTQSRRLAKSTPETEVAKEKEFQLIFEEEEE